MDRAVRLPWRAMLRRLTTERRRCGPGPHSPQALTRARPLRPGTRPAAARAGYPSRPGISWTATPSTNVARTVRLADRALARVEQVAVQDREVGELADRQRARLVEVVRVGGPGRGGGQDVHELKALVRAGTARACPRDSSRTRVTATSIWRNGSGRGDAPVGAHDQRRAVRAAASGTGTAARRPPARGPAASAPPSGPRGRPSSGWTLARAPSLRNRARSSGWTTWRWARCGRVSDQPLARRAASTASSAWRTARSPRAWKCGWNPRASRRTTACLSTRGR